MKKLSFRETLEGIRCLYGFLKGQSLLYAVGLILVSAFQLFSSLFEGQLYSTVTRIGQLGSGKIREQLFFICGLLVVLVAMRVVGIIFYQKSVARGDEALRRQLGRKLIRMPLSVWHTRHSGDWMAVLGKDADEASEVYKDQANTILACVIQAAGGLVILLWTNPVLAAWGLATGIGYMWIGFLNWKRMYGYENRQREAAGAMAAQLSNQIEGRWVSRFYNLQKVLLRKMGAALEEYEANGRQSARVSAMNGGLNQIGYTLSYSGTLIVGLILVNAGQITLPEMMAMWPLSLGIAFGLLQIGFLFTDYQSTAAAVGRLQHIFELPQEKTARRENFVDVDEEEPAVRLEHVSFSYEALEEEEGRIFSEDCRGQRKYVLQDCTLSIRKGERVAFVGESGSGKSTLMKLLLGFYRPQEGRIEVDGINAAESPSEVRSKISYVPQKSQLFDDSIYENIAIVKSGSNREDVMRAAALAGADEFIRQLPQGYETQAGEDGGKLSGGQRQRIAVARAFLKDAPIIVMDEVTAALDGKAENHINRTLTGLGKDKTVLLVTHRLSSAMLAERIVVMERGRIVEIGSHEELLKRNGYYSMLWKAGMEKENA